MASSSQKVTSVCLTVLVLLALSATILRKIEIPSSRSLFLSVNISSLWFRLRPRILSIFFSSELLLSIRLSCILNFCEGF